jgi:hypothetical protein
MRIIIIIIIIIINYYYYYYHHHHLNLYSRNYNHAIQINKSKIKFAELCITI